MSQENSEIAEVVSGGAGEKGVAEMGEEGERVAASEEVARRELHCLGSRESLAIGNGARAGRVSVDAIGSGAENGHPLAGDFFHAGQDERGITAANSFSGNRAADFSVGNERNALAGILTTKIVELGKQIVHGAIQRPIVRGVVTAGEESLRFGGVMGGMKKIVRCEEQKEVRIRECGMSFLGCLGEAGREE